ncbi:MAG TPA: TetR/AcrR family transcriptional regulator [Conexibacter sp.]|jgi:AcrR family transcriptional regulator|nr:TetR/AcrR family transcriptional regulator [Conexibacter sp.]
MPALPTRHRLLDAGVAVAERDGLAGMSVNRVVAEAGVAKGTFYVHFADRDAFVDALHERFYGRVDEAVAAATHGAEPGPDRLLRGAAAYLDACLADRGVKALLLEARADGAIPGHASAREERFAQLSAPGFRAMGWRDARVAARLFVRMISEGAILELEAGRRLPAVRRSLARFLGVEPPPRH